MIDILVDCRNILVDLPVSSITITVNKLYSTIGLVKSGRVQLVFQQINKKLLFQTVTVKTHMKNTYMSYVSFIALSCSLYYISRLNG